MKRRLTPTLTVLNTCSSLSLNLNSNIFNSHNEFTRIVISTLSNFKHSFLHLPNVNSCEKKKLSELYPDQSIRQFHLFFIRIIAINMKKSRSREGSLSNKPNSNSQQRSKNTHKSL